MNSSNFEGGAEKPKGNQQEQSAELKQLPEANGFFGGVMNTIKQVKERFAASQESTQQAQQELKKGANLNLPENMAGLEPSEGDPKDFKGYFKESVGLGPKDPLQQDAMALFDSMKSDSVGNEAVDSNTTVDAPADNTQQPTQASSSHGSMQKLTGRGGRVIGSVRGPSR